MVSYFEYKDDTFRRFLIVSVALHFSFVLFTVVKSLVFPSQEIIIPPSVRVDMVGLPDKLPEVMQPKPEAPAKTKETPKPEAAKEKPKEIPKKEVKKDSLQDAKDLQKKAMDKLKQMDAIEKIKNDVKQGQQKADPAPATATVPTYKGNIISSGNSFTGMSRLRVNDYLENLTAKIREHWVLPQWLSNSEMKVAIVIEVDSRGYVVRKEIHTSSGNSVFDSSCLSAVDEAAPFPDPPSEVQNALIMIRFPFE